MAVITYAQNAELTAILQNLLPERTFDDPFFRDVMPISSIREQMVLWEQRDLFTGYTPGRTPGTDFGQISREGKDRFAVTPVQYGEEKSMSEDFMLNSRQMGTFGDVIDLTEEQGSDQLNL